MPFRDNLAFYNMLNKINMIIYARATTVTRIRTSYVGYATHVARVATYVGGAATYDEGDATYVVGVATCVV